MPLRARCLTFILVGVLVAGCGLEEVVPFLSTPVPPVERGRPIDPDACVVVNESSDRDTYTLENLLPVAESVVIADVVGIRPGAFDTPDGRPLAPGARPPATLADGVLTPVDVVVRDVIVGDGPLGDVLVFLEGGTVGCLVHALDPAPPNLLPGHRYALVMVPNRGANDVPQPQVPLVLEAWPIDANGDIVTTFDGVLSIDELEAMVPS